MATLHLPRRPGVLCQTFMDLSRQVWGDLRDGLEYGIVQSEPSVTDMLLLNLARSAQGKIWIRKFTQQEEGRTTGADWEWWFGGRKGWFGMRVQAKRLDSRSLTYPHLNHRVPKGRKTQVNLLIDDARSRRLVPIYCFYNFVPRSVMADMDPLLSLVWPLPCCEDIIMERELCGCTIADAHHVKQCISRGTADLRSITWGTTPLHCLVCCDFVGDVHAALAERVRMGLKRIMPRRRFPAVRSELPDYASEVRRADFRYVTISPVQVGFDGVADGIVVVEEDE